MRTLVLVLVLGCGRVGFDEVARQAGDGGSDANGGGDSGDSGDSGAVGDPTICDELSGVLFCEDFEGTPRLANLDATLPAFAIETTARAYRGQRALHTHTEGPSVPASRWGSVLGAVTSGSLYARWYLYLTAQPAMFFSFSVELGGSTSRATFSVIGPQVGIYAGVASNVYVFAFPRDQWVCVQLNVIVDGSQGQVRAFVDGAPVGVTNNINTLPVGGYTDVYAGTRSTPSASGLQDAWTDELVVSTTPIPCD